MPQTCPVFESRGYIRMSVLFVPASLHAISPAIDIPTAISVATGRDGSHDYSAFVYPLSGEITVKVDGQMMSLTKAQPIMNARLASYAKAAEVVLEALKEGDLRAYVLRASDNTMWQIPRSYFFRKKASDVARGSFALWDPQSGEDVSMYGQPIILSEAQFREWRGLAPEREVVARGRGRRAGVGGYALRDAEVADEIHDMIRAGNAESPWDAAGKLLDQIPGAGTDDSRRKRVVERYYKRHPAD